MLVWRAETARRCDRSRSLHPNLLPTSTEVFGVAWIIGILERLRLSTGPGPLFAIMSRERAKLSYRWQAAYIERGATSRGGLIRVEETGEPFRVPCCPICAAQIVDKDGVPLTAEEMGRKRRTCAGCGSALWQADPKGPKRYPLADYIKKRMKGFFELLIGDGGEPSKKELGVRELGSVLAEYRTRLNKKKELYAHRELFPPARESYSVKAFNTQFQERVWSCTSALGVTRGASSLARI